MATSSISIDPRQEKILLTALAVLICALQIAGMQGVRLDDAFITFRYSQNLATGQGFVFNPGDRLLGTTAPGHALLGALVYAIAGKDFMPTVMSSIGCVAWTAQALFAYFLLRQALGKGGAAFVALAIAAGCAKSQLWVPLETNIVAALVLGAFVLAFRRKWITSGFVFGLAALVRADAFIAAPFLLALAAKEIRYRAVPMAGSMALPYAPWAIFAYAYFHHLLPHTFDSKVHYATYGAYAAHLMKTPALAVAPFGSGWSTVIVVWLLGAAGAFGLAQRDIRFVATSLYALCHALAYLLLRPDPAFTWHLYPLTLLLSIHSLAGLTVIAQAIPRFPTAVTATVASVVLMAVSYRAIEFSALHEEMNWYGRRNDLYRNAAMWLAATSGPNDWADAEEVGTLAYYSNIRFIDHPNLVTRDSVREHLLILEGKNPRLRWLVMNSREVENHKIFYGERSLLVAERSKKRLWIADLHASPTHSESQQP